MISEFSGNFQLLLLRGVRLLLERAELELLAFTLLLEPTPELLELLAFELLLRLPFELELTAPPELLLFSDNAVPSEEDGIAASELEDTPPVVPSSSLSSEQAKRVNARANIIARNVGAVETQCIVSLRVVLMLFIVNLLLGC